MKKDHLDIRVSPDLRLTLYPVTSGAECYEALDAEEYGESPWQLQEGREYDYELVDNANNAAQAYIQEKSGIIFPKRNHRNMGILKPGIYVGSMPLIVVDDNTHHQYKVILEIQSIKATYREDYRTMLNEITSYYTELVMLQGAPVTQKFEVDNNASSRTLYQKFAFVKSIVDSDAFEEAVHKIFQNPVRTWQETTVVRHVENVRRLNRSGLRQLANRTDRISCNSVGGLNSLPRTLEVPYKCDTTDTAENQFVKYVLSQFYSFCTDIAGKKNAKDELKAEANVVCNKLLCFLGNTFFKDISLPQHLNLNSPVLQRKEGYREVLQGWLIFDLAAKLNWDGGDNVYEAGKRNVAALYEYWLFFKLLEVISSVFHIKPEDKKDLVKKVNDELDLDLKQGRMKMISGVDNTPVRKLHVNFYYNRTFGHREKDIHKAGSWTMPMRPDYTLSVWPGDITEEEAEREELVIHIHFDAKYRLNKILLDDKDTTSEEIENEDSSLNKELTKEKEEEEQGQTAVGMYKRADLLKMHAYKDAIRRTSGAYILYPGDMPKRKKGFHEIIPGLGAFCISPQKSNEQVAALKRFLFQVKAHLLNRTSQREKMAFQSYEIYKEEPKYEDIVRKSLPETVGHNRNFLPSTTYVLMGYVRSKEQLEWIMTKNLYNGYIVKGFELDAEKGQAKYLLLHTYDDQCLFYKLGKGPSIVNYEGLVAKDYPYRHEGDERSKEEIIEERKDRLYLLYSLLKADDELLAYNWNAQKLKPLIKQGRASYILRAFTLSELIKENDK